MKLFTREEKNNKKLMKFYDKYLKEGLRPQKALRKAKEEYDSKYR